MAALHDPVSARCPQEQRPIDGEDHDLVPGNELTCQHGHADWAAAVLACKAPNQAWL